MGDDSWPAYGTSDEKDYQFKPLDGKCLQLSIKAAHDCHVCFSSIAEDNDDVFEVFIGAWEGAASAIRFKKSDDVAKEDTPDILSADEVRNFWITFDDDLVRVGRGGEMDPFMEAQLPEHIDITYFGYSTGWGATGWWQFPHEKSVATEDCLTYNYIPVYGTSFTFSVSCSNDAHIALTSAAEDTAVMYEVFLGGWSNQVSAIRLNNDRDLTVGKEDTPDCMCGDEERTFWISFKDGRLRVGRKGESDPFMEYTDSTPWTVTHVGYCTGWGATGNWKLEV